MGIRTAVNAVIVTMAALLSAGAVAGDGETVSGTTSASGSGQIAPRPDSKGRTGQWRWRKTTEGSEGTVAAAGNRGKVFGRGEEPIPVASSGIPAPPPPPPQPGPQAGSTHDTIMLNNILFLNDSAELRKEGAAEIDKLVAEMMEFRGDTVVCVGHTDDTGSPDSNLELGLRRAEAVKQYMVAAGVGAERIATTSQGESQPAVPNDSPANRALNRRVEFERTAAN